ncbi:hypothetical protein PR048_008109 [Dryococelus australis]|uniref:DUF4371 domain-containing protein n=1 Tax=Dryococelus australis TaxID=614101 RepID=A0ABQ9HW53_9NEOP|nr:hypothetical protein PR048_008109 [Dryococelus australis]
MARDYRQNKDDKWISATIRGQTGPLTYAVETCEGMKWRHHIDQLGVRLRCWYRKKKHNCQEVGHAVDVGTNERENYVICDTTAGSKVKCAKENSQIREVQGNSIMQIKEKRTAGMERRDPSPDFKGFSTDNMYTCKSKVDPTFIVTGFSNWKKLQRNFHIMKGSFTFQSKASQKDLITIVSSIKFLVTRGLALRSKQEKEGNLYELLELRGNEIPDIKDWLFKRHNWLSHVVRNLNQDIKKNKYCALIVDETTDNSTKEQVSSSLRHVNDDFDVFDDFIGLYETSSTTGDTLTDIIEDVLLRLNLPVEDC